ncbi:MAG TPA: hypothetical protein VGO58_10290 [Chitinophagaceae bacterium]|jgi:hypothetical protein|nr:hypothetical protein [Chitinophagaceae bacterium]
MKKPLLVALIVLSLVNAKGQKLQDAGEPVKTAPGVSTIPVGSCHWAYSIGRINTTSDGKYYYQISFSLVQLDNNKNPAGTVKIENAKIICSFKIGTKNYSVRFFPKDDIWVAKFFIQTYRAVPLTLTTEYFNQKSMMTEATLNQGRYPGED